MRKYFGVLLLGAALAAPAISLADDHRYYDRDHKDWHEWNGGEDRAYRHWLEERHEAYVEWARASRAQQRAYWRWRHEHMDWR